MAEFSKLVITADGQGLITKILLGLAANVDFTMIRSSSHVYTVDELEGLTALEEIVQETRISRKSFTNNVAMKVEGVFTNTELTVGYHMNTLGLYAVDPDKGEILYAATVEKSGNCYMPAYNGITVSGAYISLVTTVGNADNVTLEVNPAAVATIKDLQDLRKELDGKAELDETGHIREAEMPWKHYVIAERERDPNKPDYGAGGGGEEGGSVALNVSPYTGSTRAGVVVSGVLYDANNVGFSGEANPEGTIILTESEE